MISDVSILGPSTDEHEDADSIYATADQGCGTQSVFDRRQLASASQQMVHEWLDQHLEQIEVFYLPSYSPEINPDEYLNCDLKVGVHSGVPATSKSELAKKAIGHLRMLQAENS